MVGRPTLPPVEPCRMAKTDEPITVYMILDGELGSSP